MPSFSSESDDDEPKCDHTTSTRIQVRRVDVTCGSFSDENMMKLPVGMKKELVRAE